jgi:hypothetical protein
MDRGIGVLNDGITTHGTEIYSAWIDVLIPIPVLSPLYLVISLLAA